MRYNWQIEMLYIANITVPLCKILNLPRGSGSGSEFFKDRTNFLQTEEMCLRCYKTDCIIKTFIKEMRETFLHLRCS